MTEKIKEALNKALEDHGVDPGRRSSVWEGFCRHYKPEPEPVLLWESGPTLPWEEASSVDEYAHLSRWNDEGGAPAPDKPKKGAREVREYYGKGIVPKGKRK